MKAVLLEGFGGPEVMHMGEAPKPEVVAERVVIKVMATSVNRPDVVQRLGAYPPPPGESEILGLEVAGVIDAVGPGVSGLAVGDRVIALIGGGGYAEYASAYAAHVIPLPASMSFEQGACICETYITAFLNVFRGGELEDGQSVLLHGGGGGVNTAGIQLVSKLAPASPIIVTASPGKIERVKALGASLVIDYRSQDFAEVAREFTGGRGVDVILDHIGAPYLAANLKCLAVGGRLVLIGVMGGAKAEINLAAFMVKRQHLIGSVLRSRPVAEKAAIIADFTKVVMPLFASGAISPLIHAVYPLEQAAAAHREMESSAHFGKIVLTP
jgi:NADPH2:quinone reductase